jgi:hypothetical protein
MDDAPRAKLKAGDPAIVPLEDWNRVRAEMLRLLALGAVPPLQWSHEGGRRSLGDMTPRGLWVKLSGSSSPYTATEQVRSGGTWIDGARALTNVVEVNGGSGLANTLQFVEPGAPGEWLFQSVKLGSTTIVCGSSCALDPITYTLTIGYLDSTLTLRSKVLPFPYLSGVNWRTASTDPSTWTNPPSGPAVSIVFQLACVAGIWIIQVLPAAGGAQLCNFQPTQADSTCTPLFLHWLSTTGPVPCSTFRQFRSATVTP